jgi:2-alkyl-3-oxoalkanoate reductase
MVIASDLPARVVVTGAAGVLGSHLCTRLSALGCRVHGVDVRPTPGVEHTVADVRDAAAMARACAGADALIHCAAALPSYPEAQIRSVLVDGSRTVLTAARAAAVRRVVHISSTAVYGLPTAVPDEAHPREPVDVYGAAKSEAEVIAEELRAGGMCLSILRPKTFLGPGRLGLFAMLFQWAEEGRNFPVLGDGKVRIQMLGLDDLVDAVLAVLAADPCVASDTYNLGAAEFATLREDFQAVLDAAGHGKRVVSIPAKPAVATLSLLQRLRLSPVYNRLVHKLTADSYVDISKARQRLGFSPQLSNQDAILRTYAWWRSSGARKATRTRTAGRVSNEPWRQGALAALKIFF